MPKIQRYLIEQMLKNEPGLKELLELAKDGSPGAGAAAEDESQAEEQKQARFAHRQKVADDFVQAGLAALKVKLNELFLVEECTQQLQKAASKEEKLAAFKALQAESLGRAVAAVYVVNLVLLLHRVNFNIVSREIAASEAKAPGGVAPGGEQDAAYRLFLDATGVLQDAGLRSVSESIHRATQERLQKAEILPQTKVTGKILRDLFNEICGDASGELFGSAGAGQASQDSHAVQVLLPDSILAEVPEAQKEKVKSLLDEAQDALENPNCVFAFRKALESAVQELTSQLTGEGQALAGEAPVACGKLSGPLIDAGNSAFEVEGENRYVAAFAREPTVRELSEILYF